MGDIRSSMKALIPFILPLVVLIILGAAFWRWVQNNSKPEISDNAASVEVMEVDQATTTELARGADDVPTVNMVTPDNAPESADDSQARVRYQIEGNTASLLVLASLVDQTEEYTVWLKPSNSEVLTRAFVLEEGKGGLMGTASVPVSSLPLTVYLTTADTMADVPTNTYFEAVIPAPAAE